MLVLAVVEIKIKTHPQQSSTECVLNGSTVKHFPTTNTPPPFSTMTVLTTALNVLNIHAAVMISLVLLDPQQPLILLRIGQIIKPINAWDSRLQAVRE